MANERITVTILNWDKFNPRKDIKHPTWFALSNRFLEDPDFYDFSPIEFKATIYIFCQASQKNSERVTINTAHAKRVCDIEADVLRRTIEKLSMIGCVQVESDPRTESERARTESERDKQDKQDKQYKQNKQDLNDAGFKDRFENHPTEIHNAMFTRQTELEQIVDLIDQAFDSTPPPRLRSSQVIATILLRFGNPKAFAEYLNAVLAEEKASTENPSWRTYVEGRIMTQLRPVAVV